MQQTALNLIAIGVFTITMSSLLGPFLHISPMIPVGATLGIMGLATLDTLSWESRGVTLLLDALSPAHHRQRILHHEAGHLLAAYCLGIPVVGYTLTAWEAFKQGQPGLGGVIFDTDALVEKGFDIREMPLLLERFSTVWMAGIAAETLTYGEATGGGEDKQKMWEALRVAGVSEIGSRQKERWALLQAKNLIEKHQVSYQALVTAMEKRASVEECYEIIQQHLTVESD